MTKLLGGLAITLTILALVVAGLPTQGLYFHAHFVITPSEFMLLDALTCGFLAVLYFAISRWKLRPPNQLVGLVSFALIVVSLFILLAVNFVRIDSPPHYSELYALFGALYGFLLGLALLAANLAWALAWTLCRKVRSHLSFG
jgi:hypothetical protein